GQSLAALQERSKGVHTQPQATLGCPGRRGTVFRTHVAVNPIGLCPGELLERGQRGRERVIYIGTATAHGWCDRAVDTVCLSTPSSSALLRRPGRRRVGRNSGRLASSGGYVPPSDSASALTGTLRRELTERHQDHGCNDRSHDLLL